MSPLIRLAKKLFPLGPTPRLSEDGTLSYDPKGPAYLWAKKGLEGEELSANLYVLNGHTTPIWVEMEFDKNGELIHFRPDTDHSPIDGVNVNFLEYKLRELCADEARLEPHLTRLHRAKQWHNYRR